MDQIGVLPTVPRDARNLPFEIHRGCSLKCSLLQELFHGGFCFHMLVGASGTFGIELYYDRE